MNMIDWARTLGFEIVAAGRGTVYFDADRTGVPDTVPERFGFSDEMMARRTINLKMYNSFRDGTKAQVEMAASGQSGRARARCARHARAFRQHCRHRRRSFQPGRGGRPAQQARRGRAGQQRGRGWRNPAAQTAWAWASLPSSAPSIPSPRRTLRDYFLHPGGDGQNYLLYRPYHLVAVEAPSPSPRPPLWPADRIVACPRP